MPQPGQVLQLAQRRRGGLPGGRLLGGAEAGNDLGIQRIVSRARQEAVGIMADAAGIDDADSVLLFVQEQGQGVAVTAGGFETGMQVGGLLLEEPAPEFFEAGRRVCEQGVVAGCVERAGWPEANVELVFADVDAKNMCDFHVWVQCAHYLKSAWGNSDTNKLVEDLSSVGAPAIRIRFVLVKAGESGPNSVGTHNGSSAAWVYPTPPQASSRMSF